MWGHPGNENHNIRGSGRGTLLQEKEVLKSFYYNSGTNQFHFHSLYELSYQSNVSGSWIHTENTGFFITVLHTSNSPVLWIPRIRLPPIRADPLAARREYIVVGWVESVWRGERISTDSWCGVGWKLGRSKIFRRHSSSSSTPNETLTRLKDIIHYHT